MRKLKELFAKFFRCLYISLRDFIDHDGYENAGHISFLIILGIFPFLFFSVSFIEIITKKYLGNILGEKIAVSLTNMILAENTWSHFIAALKPAIVEILKSPPQNFVALAIISSIWVSSSILAGLRNILNKALRIDNPPSYLIRRFISIMEFFLIVLVILFIILCFHIMPYFLQIFASSLSVGNLGIIKDIVSFFVNTGKAWSFFIFVIALITVGYACCLLPNHSAKLIDMIPGSVFSVCVWHIFSNVFKYYLTTVSQISLIYGSIAGIVVSLLYFHVCSMIFIYGGELNYHFKVMFGSRVIKVK